ncbi:hypothetical protein HUN42_00073 [Streptomyces phage Dagobah]|nr:hypothetical protein HUN42_00073 [Streptomyces phage Dagobah]
MSESRRNFLKWMAILFAPAFLLTLGVVYLIPGNNPLAAILVGGPAGAATVVAAALLAERRSR